MEPEVVFKAEHELGEGPVWHADALWWVNIQEGTLQEGDPANGSFRSMSAGRMVGAAVPAQDGSWLLAAANGFYRWSTFEGAPELLCEPEEGRTENRFNDGKVDPAGRFWAGSMHFGVSEPTAALYSFDAGAAGAVPRLDGLTISNGLAWHAERACLYHIDTPTQVVRSFHWDAATGDLADAGVAVNLREENGSPDGMCIDEDGNLWIAMWGGHQVVQADPRSGRVLRRLRLPASQVTSCAFGGSRHSTLFITTARGGLSSEALAREPEAGNLFAVETDVTGPPVTLFGGNGS